MTKLATEEEMIEFGKSIGQTISVPCVIELIGDVGTGKTTITKGIASALGIADEVTSPSFTISKRYSFEKDGRTCELVHYDFYRLPEPGIMEEDLLENINDTNTVVVIEWGNSVADLLPETRRTFLIKLNDDGARTIEEQK
jgi:tRNA threonylcarbamoyladenosine biosynthesis protein TsaE